MRKIRATYEAVKGILKDGKVGVKEGRRERGRLKKESSPGQLGSLHHAAALCGACTPRHRCGCTFSFFTESYLCALSFPVSCFHFYLFFSNSDLQTCWDCNCAFIPSSAQHAKMMIKGFSALAAATPITFTLPYPVQPSAGCLVDAWRRHRLHFSFFHV